MATVTLYNEDRFEKFHEHVVELVKEKCDIDCSVLKRDFDAGLKWLDLSDYGYVGCVLLSRYEGKWTAQVLPYNLKKLMGEPKAA